MVKLELEDFEFREEDDKVKFVFMRYYHFLVDKSDLEKIGKFKVHKNFIDFDASEKTLTNKINRILKIGMDELTSILGKRAIYIHRDSGIPLLGTNEFGIVDRDTNIIEVKPHTLCNLDCIYCSVDAGKSSRKVTDFVVEPEYLVQEFNKIASTKQHPVEASINPQGEPLMYSRLVDLIKGLKALKSVKTASINTNGTLLTEKLIDQLAEAGLDRINLSLNTVNQDTANKLAGNVYPLEKVKHIILYSNNRIEILIAPLIVPGYNDGQIEETIEFCKENNITRFGFQNFFNYQRGRNPVKQKSMEWFLKLLKENEERFNIKLVNKAEDYDIHEDSKIPKPFKKNDVVNTRIVLPGKYANESIAVSEERCITVSVKPRSKDVRVKIVRDKHNIFRAVLAT
ncbi:radical SAM protein [Candidatus Woesearchaeota archaeon]|nr:radical SAM protein [Candidatus Woesearchaeota archaeon]